MYRLLTALLLLAAMISPGARAQDLYDPTTLRTFSLQFRDANWLQLLRQNYVSQTLILADLTVDGVTYPGVGVRIRGNTSYTALPAGSEKFSLKIAMDFTNPNQDLLGYDSINLNNGFRDPTFAREMVYNNFVAQFIPNPRANHVLVTLNGQNWGVYINVQQGDKRMLRDYYANADGLRVSCANNPNGPGLAYAGTNPASYAAYEIQADGGLSDPLGTLIALTNTLSNAPLTDLATIDRSFAIDPSIWSVALENLLTDDDSYINKGCDFMVYRNPIDGRSHLQQRDANETFTQASWAITRNFTQTNKPVLNRLLSVPELRQRYLAHYRTIRRDLNWTYFGPRFEAVRQRIAAAVQADPKKLYSYALFESNYTTTVNLPLPGLAGGSIIGVQQFVDQRGTFLNGNAELGANGPDITAAQASRPLPSPSDPVYITATVTANGSPISRVDLYYRPRADEIYQRVPMRDDGLNGDGAAGDGVYGALLPITAAPGQRVLWYVGATGSNSFQSQNFRPALAERGPAVLEYSLGLTTPLRISEWMYAGVNGEFIELTNIGATPIDLTGWSIDDTAAVPGAFPIGAIGILAPGQSALLTENTDTAFRTAWSVPENVRIVGQLGVVAGNNLGRNDQIHVYDAGGNLVDRLFYGDQTYVGTIRTQNASGQAPCSALGRNEVALWQLSAIGDGYGSVASAGGDVGTPGRYDVSTCSSGGTDPVFRNGFEPASP